MRTRRSSSRNGQALVMVTVALFAMCGMIGLAVDFGWSFFVRRAAQSAADAAATAAVNKAWDLFTSGATLDCSGLVCQSTPADCSTSPGGNLKFACDYAGRNGFSSGGDNGKQRVTVTADTTSPPPTVPGVNVYYWVTVRITNTIPQLYSAILGNANATVAARATAAIVNTNVRASLIALNRQNDAGPNGNGVDLKMSGNAKVEAANGIFLASTNSLSNGPTSGAADCENSCQGSTGYPDITKPVYTLIRSSGTTKGGVTGTDSATWPWQNQADGAPFYDPMRNMAQPPLGTGSLPPIGVPGGNLSAASVPQCSTGTCPAAAYYATDASGNATGAPITVNSAVNFGGSAFGNYVFFGGLNLSGATVDFGPGRYVMAGVQNPSTSYDLSIYQSIVTGGTGSDAGRMFILTDTNYPGLSALEASLPASVRALSLSYGASVIGGTAAQSIDTTTRVTLTGLDPANSSLPADANAKGYTLKDFGPMVIWQDQGFSNVKYTPSGNIDTSCAGCSLDSPGTKTSPINPTTPPFLISVRPPLTAPTTLNGIVYQPRGSWMRLGANARVTAMEMISGAFDSGSGPNAAHLILPPLPTALLRRAVALVE